MTGNLIEEVALYAKISERNLMAIVANAPKRYKVYYIAKKAGGRRIIAQPAKELKVVQLA